MVEGDLLSKFKQKKYLNKGISNKALSNGGQLNGPYKPISLQELTMTVPSELFRGLHVTKTQSSNKKKTDLN